MTPAIVKYPRACAEYELYRMLYKDNPPAIGQGRNMKSKNNKYSVFLCDGFSRVIATREKRLNPIANSDYYTIDTTSKELFSLCFGGYIPAVRHFISRLPSEGLVCVERVDTDNIRMFIHRELLDNRHFFIMPSNLTARLKAIVGKDYGLTETDVYRFRRHLLYMLLKNNNNASKIVISVSDWSSVVIEPASSNNQSHQLKMDCLKRFLELSNQLYRARIITGFLFTPVSASYNKSNDTVDVYVDRVSSPERLPVFKFIMTKPKLFLIAKYKTN